MAIEILAITIRSDPSIQGISIEDKEFKIAQYADDLTAFLANIDSVNKLLKLLDSYGECSRLNINYTKTEAMWIGVDKENTVKPFGFKWLKIVKGLGVCFCYDIEEREKCNFFNKFKKVYKEIEMWKWRRLSLCGKATIIKTVLIPKFIHVMSTMPTPTGFIKQLEKIIFKFLWNGPDKISRSASINKIKYGGLNITDITTFIKIAEISLVKQSFCRRK